MLTTARPETRLSHGARDASDTPAKTNPAAIYFDYNGSAPTPRAVVEAMLPFLTGCPGNLSAGHWASGEAQAALDAAHAAVADLIGARPDEIVLTSGGTEANNTALLGVCGATRRDSPHVVTAATEHDSVLAPLRVLRRKGVRLSTLPVDGYGRVDPESVSRAIRPETALISVMHANNETGTLNPIREIAEIGRQNGVLVHADAAQSVGKIDVDVAALGVDLLSIAGHKFGAPKGIGALYVRDGVQVTPLLHGGGQQAGRRAGTESALLAAGLATAARIAMIQDRERVRALRDYFWNGLVEASGGQVVLQGHPHARVPNTLNVAFPGRKGTDILARMPFVAATTGSACHASCVSMSRVLVAMGVPISQGLGTIRFSLGGGNTVEEIDRVVGALRDILR